MTAWLVLLLLLVTEVVAIRWWLHKEFYPLFFNGWAGLIYTSILGTDFIVTWLVSNMSVAGGTAGTTLLMLAGVAMIVVAFLFTLFFRWVVRHDMTDIPK